MIDYSRFIAKAATWLPPARLLMGYKLEEEASWVKDIQNRWVLAEKEVV